MFVGPLQVTTAPRKSKLRIAKKQIIATIFGKNLIKGITQIVSHFRGRDETGDCG
jgi:hypothetical protein